MTDTWTAPSVDRPSGPNVAPERRAAEDLLEYHRATLLWKCAGLTGDQLATRAVPPSTMSLLGLVRHMADVERSWFRRRVAGEQIDHLFSSDASPDGDFDDVDPAAAEADFATYGPRSRPPARSRPRTTSTTRFVSRHGDGTEETIDVRALGAAHDRGVRPAQRPRRPAARGHRRLDRRLTGRLGRGWSGRRRLSRQRCAGDQPGLTPPPDDEGDQPGEQERVERPPQPDQPGVGARAPAGPAARSRPG